MLLWSVVFACAAGALAAVAPGGRYNLQGAEGAGRGRQLYYLQQPYAGRFAPQLQRLEPAVVNADAQYYEPSQQRQDPQSYSVAEKESKEESAKLETLEPDAELLPGAQQGQQPQGPPTQVPVSPAGIPGLLPGQRFYIVHPQHQIYNQNPLYPALPNGFRPNVQVPGYQRFYIVQAQPGVDGNFAPQGYQNTILVDPSGQPINSQVLQPNFQRLVVPEVPQQAAAPEPTKSAEPNRNYAEPNANQALANQNFVDTNLNYPVPLRGYQGPQQAQFGAQPQYGPAFNGAPLAALPFFGFGRQQIPFQQQGFNDLQANRNAIQFAQLLSLQQGLGGQYAAPAQLQGAPQPPPAAQAQGRNDDYSDEEKKEDISTEANTFEETVKKGDDKSAQPATEETKSTEDTKEEVDKSAANPSTATNIQAVPKRS